MKCAKVHENFSSLHQESFLAFKFYLLEILLELHASALRLHKVVYKLKIDIYSYFKTNSLCNSKFVEAVDILDDV